MSNRSCQKLHRSVIVQQYGAILHFFAKAKANKNALLKNTVMIAKVRVARIRARKSWNHGQSIPYVCPVSPASRRSACQIVAFCHVEAYLRGSLTPQISIGDVRIGSSESSSHPRKDRQSPILSKHAPRL